MTTITTVIDPPLVTDTPAVFNTKAFEAWMDINTWATEVNTVASEINTNTTTATTKAAEALASANASAASASTATTKAAEALASAATAQLAESNTQAIYTNAGSMLGINFGSFTLVDGELVVTHLSTSTPSLVDGDLILTYETL